MTLEQALRGVARAIATLHTPTEREVIAFQIHDRVKKNSSSLWMSLEDFAVCFHPSQNAKAAAVLKLLKAAQQTGQLSNTSPNNTSADELAMWPQRPPIAPDSPLAYWFGDVLDLPTASPAGLLEDKKPTPRASWRTELPYITMVYCDSTQTSPKGLWRELQQNAEKASSPFIVGKGDGVYDAWLNGEYERIAAYNLRDTLATRDVWHRLNGGKP